MQTPTDTMILTAVRRHGPIRQFRLRELVHGLGIGPAEPRPSQWFMDTYVAPWLEEQRQRFLAAADEAAPPSTDAPSPEEQPA